MLTDMRPILIISLIFILTGCDNSKNMEEPYSIPKDDPLFIDFSNIPEKRGDGSVYEGDDMDFDIKDYVDKQRASERNNEAIDQEYPCQDPVDVNSCNEDERLEMLVRLNKKFYCNPEIYGGSGPKNNIDPDVCKDYVDKQKRSE